MHKDPIERTIIMVYTLSPSVWVGQRGRQGDKLVINQLITIISPCSETLLLLSSNYACLTPTYLQPVQMYRVFNRAPWK